MGLLILINAAPTQSSCLWWLVLSHLEGSNILSACGSSLLVIMSTSEFGVGQQPLEEDAHTTWMKSSQKAANLYRDGVKIWTKEGLADIEHQLARNLEIFTICSIDGQEVKVKNPQFGVKWSIWYGILMVGFPLLCSCLLPVSTK